jgi:hypothetical protein
LSFPGPLTQWPEKPGITWPFRARPAEVRVVVEKLSDWATLFWFAYVDVTVVPLCASVRTAPSWNPLMFKKVFPDGL